MIIYNPGVLRSAPRRISFDLAMIVSASLLIAVSAKVQVPFFPVPMTMQTFVVFGISLTSVRSEAVLPYSPIFSRALQGFLSLPALPKRASVSPTFWDRRVATCSLVSRQRCWLVTSLSVIGMAHSCRS